MMEYGKIRKVNIISNKVDPILLIYVHWVQNSDFRLQTTEVNMDGF